MSALSSPISTSFSPSPLSPQIRMPTSPSAPSTPLVNTSTRLLSASPEPLSPTPTSPVSLATTGTIGSRFGSLFSNKSSRRDMEERSLSEQSPSATMGKDNVDPVAVVKKKRLSTGSLQIPIGAFLTNSFRNMQQQGAQHKQQQSPQQQLQSVQEQEYDQPQQPPQRKKRRSLLPKLPKLDTRPRIIISRSGSKKQKEAMQNLAMGHGDEAQAPPELSTVDPAAVVPEPESNVVPGSAATATKRPRGSRSSSLKTSPKLLSPFYVPPQIRTGAGSHSTQYLDPNVRLPPPPMVTTTEEKNDSPTATTATGSQAGQQLLDVSFNPTFEWRRDSQVFYDDRWDRASVRTVDTEIIRLSDDPNFPGYPERNDYWQEHCRIRERRWKHQIQKHQQQQITDARSPKKWLYGVKANPVTGLAEDDTVSLLEEEDESDDDEGRTTDRDGPLADRLRDVTNLLNSLPETTARRTRQSTAPQSSHQNRFRQRRVRYTTYSAYIAAMQVKSKNRTDHKRSLDVAAMASPGSDTNKLMDDVRALRERSMTQPTNVKDTADRFGGTVMVDTDWLHGQRRHTHCHEGTNLGSRDDENEDQYEAEDRVHPMSSFNTLQRQRQPDSGILFVAAAATTAEVYPTLVHDPRERQQRQQLRNKSSAAKAKMDHHHFHSKHTSTPNCWIEDGYDEGMIGCLVASYFDKSFLEDHFKSVMDGSIDDDDKAATVGNGFMVLQSSFGDQGFYKRLNEPHRLSTCRVTRRPQRS
ncbi:hypothetical protein EC991_009975 [Linnemannia zychae]|nr:hypothetical protein EC991_009975 [Linnemannia zychae]